MEQREYTETELEGLHRVSLEMAEVFVEFCQERVSRGNAHADGTDDTRP